MRMLPVESAPVMAGEVSSRFEQQTDFEFMVGGDPGKRNKTVIRCASECSV